jgi:hypothetical protein
MRVITPSVRVITPSVRVITPIDILAEHKEQTNIPVSD